MNSKGLRLSELNKQIKEVLQLSFPDSVWVIGEISDFKVNSSGHCYLELIEKDPQSNNLIAKQKAIIWSYTFRMLSPYFESSTGYKLTSGLKILVNVHIEYHEVFGISLIIKDIEPSYTLGDLAAKKREIILRLKEEGVIEMNRSIPLPMVPQRIAVISSETAAGFGDFQSSLHKNSHGFSFYTELFQAYMQGEKAELSIIEALDKIFERERDFDIVVIIRGGGAASDLECFNNYNLAYYITQFPIPILTGIGHERDETVADLVAHTSLKTPTAVAEFIIDTAIEFENLIDSLENRFNAMIMNLLSIEKQKLAAFTQNLNYIFIKLIQNKKIWIQNSFQRLGILIRQFRKRKSDRLDNYTYLSGIYSNFIIKQGFVNLKEYKSNLDHKTLQLIQLHQEKLNEYERNINYLDPLNVLRRGFSITFSGGKLIKDSSDLKQGDELETIYHKGSTRSIVIRKHHTGNPEHGTPEHKPNYKTR